MYILMRSNERRGVPRRAAPLDLERPLYYGTEGKIDQAKWWSLCAPGSWRFVSYTCQERRGPGENSSSLKDMGTNVLANGVLRHFFNLTAKRCSESANRVLISKQALGEIIETMSWWYLKNRKCVEDTLLRWTSESREAVRVESSFSLNCIQGGGTFPQMRTVFETGADFDPLASEKLQEREKSPELE